MEVLGVITARGGSKSILRKSIALCAGQPLMQYTINAAKNSKKITRLIITTDDIEFAELAKKSGVDVPFIRPAELGHDLSTDLEVFQHALHTLNEQEGYQPEVVVHLRPTTPLKKTSDIDTAIELLMANPTATSVRSVCEPSHTPFKMYSEKDEYLVPILKEAYPEIFLKYPEPFNMPRQLLPTVWRHSGYVDVIRTEVITQHHSMSGASILPLPFDSWRDIDIDSPHELSQAESVIGKLREQGIETWM